MTNEGVASRGWRRKNDSQETMLLTASFWLFAFIVNEGVSSIRDELSFELAGGHRVAAFGFAAMLALATASILTQTRHDPRKQTALAGSAIILMPILHAAFFFATCKVSPIAGVEPMTAREAMEKGLLSTGYFVAWVAMQFAIIYRHDARKGHGSVSASDKAPVASSCQSDKRYWASWRNQRVRIGADEIRWIQAQKDYAILHCLTRSCIMRTTLASLAVELPVEDFVRVHRSAIVRRSVIASIDRRQTGALVLKTTCGAVLPVGRSYASALRDLLDQDRGGPAGRSSQIFDAGRPHEGLSVRMQ